MQTKISLETVRLAGRWSRKTRTPHRFSGMSTTPVWLAARQELGFPEMKHVNAKGHRDLYDVHYMKACSKLLDKSNHKHSNFIDRGWFYNRRMRLFYLQLRSFYLRFVFFTYGGGTVSKKDQTQFPDRGNRKQKRPNLISGQGGTVSKKDQTDFHRKQRRPNRISTRK